MYGATKNPKELIKIPLGKNKSTTTYTLMSLPPTPHTVTKALRRGT